MVILFFVDRADGGNWWFYWPALGWGVFIVIQGSSIGIFNPEWEDKKIKEIMDKEKK